jgi:hypothetical protein
MDFQNFINDLQELNPIEVDPLIPPYQDEASLEKQVLRTFNCLRRSIKLRSRILSLINAYFLGKIFAGVESSTQRFLLKRNLTKHYQTMVENTFDLFEFNPSQILRTKYLNVQDLRKMKCAEILYLRDCLLDPFAGAQSLEEESC